MQEEHSAYAPARLWVVPPATGPQAGPLGLSTGHIRPLQSSAFATAGYIENFRGGMYARLRVLPRHGDAPPRGGYASEPAPGMEPHPLTGLLWQPAHRGAILGFSLHSRRRLIALTAQVDYAALGYRPRFITLTYPDEFSRDPEKAARDLAAFRRAFERKYGRPAVIWRKEYQERGAPHFHLLVFTAEWIDRAWLALTWYRIVGSGDPKHVHAGTEIRACKSARHTLAYVSKYMAKEEQHDPATLRTGRLWGVWNRTMLPRERHVTPLYADEWFAARRVLAKYLVKHGARGPRLGERGTPEKPVVCEPGRVGASARVPWRDMERYVAYLTRERPRHKLESAGLSPPRGSK